MSSSSGSNAGSSQTGFLYHAAVAVEWEARSPSHYQPAAYAGEGFVHLSAESQLIGTLNKHYPGRSDLVLLTIDPNVVTAELVWEDLYGSGIEFPHIYGPINTEAVVSTAPLSCDADGRFDTWDCAIGQEQMGEQ